MINLGQSSRAQLKRMFFDRAAVISAVDRATVRVLSRFGAWTRRLARNSIRERKNASAPGEPPHSHSGHLKRGIMFAWDPTARSVVIGPERLNQIAFDPNLQVSRGLVPHILEYGGREGVVERAARRDDGSLVWTRRNLTTYGSRWLLATLRARNAAGQVMQGVSPGEFVVAAGHHRFRTFSVKARPYMNPAFEKAERQLPDLWLNCVKRSA